MGTVDGPNINYGSQVDYKRLIASECCDPKSILAAPCTIQKGYGKLEAGTAMAENKSAAGGDGKFVPYNPTSFDGTAGHPGRAYIVANTDTTGSTVDVTITDSYKFAVGDDLIINDSNTAAENLGAITAIDRTTYINKAQITFTTAIGGTAFETQYDGYVCVEAGDSSNNYSDCVGVLEKTVGIGDDADAADAGARIIFGNCVFYTGCLVNVDSAARTDLSATVWGQYTYVR